MQNHFTYDELTPLEQCILNFMARQDHRHEQKREKTTKKKEPVRNS